MSHATWCRRGTRLKDICLSTLAALVLVLAFPSQARAQGCGLRSPARARTTSPLTEITKREARTFQAELRRRFPDHVQGVFQQPISTGRSAIVIAEPPPNATAEGMQRRLGARFVEIVPRRVGYDGWSKDLVAIVDHQDRATLADGIVRLDAYLYGTSYRAGLLPSEGRRTWKVPGLDVAVSPSELKRWVLGDDAQFVSIDGAIVVTGEDLRRKTALGVFRTLTPGIVVWAVPHRADLCQHQGELREFALESDLVLGAILTAQNVLFVGRERRASVEVFPPLRSESILMLAATGTSLLAQSYQRLALFSGKLRSGKDWAPILLSDELQGTEFGSLLNFTDQMLKSWSLNGRVRYEGFDFYPDPDHWAAPQTVAERLNTGTLTFNWNTSGATAFSQDHESAVLSVLRTGALPITYIPENQADARISLLEASYQDYFASLGNPDLARVVAYTAMYEALRLFDFKATCYSRGTGERKGEALLTERANAFVAAVQRGDAGLKQAARASLGADGENFLGKAREQFDEIERTEGAAGLREFVYYLASVRGPRGVEQRKDHLLKRAERWAVDPDFAWLKRSTLNRDDVMARYVGSARPSEQRWLRTPTVVLSTAAAASGYYVEGGHNVAVRPFEIVTDPTMPRRQPRIETFEGRTRVRVHPADSDFVWSLTPVFKKIADKRVPAAAAEAEMNALAQSFPESGVRPMPHALWRDAGPPYWPEQPRFGWFLPANPPAASAPPANGRIRIERRGSGFEVWLPGHAAPSRAESPISLAESLNAFISQPGQGHVVLEFAGMREEQARALRQTLRLQLRRLLASGNNVPQSVEVVSGAPRGPPRWFEPKNSVISIGAPREVRSDAGTVYECTLLVKDRTLFMQVNVAMKQKITEPVRRAIRRVAEGVMQRKKQSGPDAARAIRAVLKQSYKDVAIDVMVEDGEACNHVIANR